MPIFAAHAAALLLSLCAAVSQARSEPMAEAPVGEVWTARGEATRLLFNEHLLADLGLEVRDSVSRQRLDPRQLSFAAPRPSSLPFVARGSAFVDFTGGTLRHAGGFDLFWEGGTVSLASFELRPGPAPRTFEIAGAGGEVVFLADHMHFEFAPGRRLLKVFNMDLRLSPNLAERLGEPRHAGLAVGRMEIDAAVELPATGASSGLPCPGPAWDLEVDVALLDIGSVGQTFREGGRVAISPSAVLKNVGAAPVPWYTKFSGEFPPHGNDQHPFLVWALYRLSGGRIEMIGRSELKHAFRAINSSCDPPFDRCEHPNYSNILWPGCEDVYGQNTNSSRNHLAFRAEVTAGTGVWERCGSFFDPDCDGEEDERSPADGFERRMTVAEADLDTPGAEYHIEAWYVVRGDVDIFNSMGNRQVLPRFGGSVWSFTPVTLLQHGPALDRWVDPASPGPGAVSSLLDTGEGHLKLAVQVTDLGAGRHRYEYALMNLDFDRQIETFRLPVGHGTLLSAIGFRDVDENAGNDWTAEVGSHVVTWKAPPGEGLDWGTLYNFVLEANHGPRQASATLGVMEPGAPAEVRGVTLTPGPPLDLQRRFVILTDR